MKCLLKLIIFQILYLTLSCQGGGAVILWYPFESSADYVKEAITGRREPIKGFYRCQEGVCGQALVCDGQTTQIVCRAKDVPQLRGALTIEAWIAPQTYSWNWTGVVSQRETSASGEHHDGCMDRIFLGINDEGRIGFRLNLGGEVQQCVTADPVDLLTWVYITATYDAQNGMKLYIDGNVAAQKKVCGRLSAGGGDLLIGQNHCRMAPTQSERRASAGIISRMVFDGLLDEVRIFDYALTDAQIRAYYTQSMPDNKQPLNYRQMPTGDVKANNVEFGAFHTTLPYCPEWDAHWPIGPHADIVVTFDRLPVRLLFWHGTGYGAVWSTENGKLMADQSLERVGPDKSPWGCSEHMSDKQCRYSHVRLIANSDARAVVHWRYAICDIKYNIFGMKDNSQSFGEWADEYYFIYPDGVATRYQKLWTDHLRHEWQETIVLHQPGTRPEDNIELDAMVFANMSGESCVYSWKTRPDRNVSKPENPLIQVVNLKSHYKPFIIFQPDNNLRLFSPDAIEDGQHFPWWNHWPAAQIPNDGRQTHVADRPGHSSLSQSLEDSDAIKQTSENTCEAVTLTGMTNQGVEGLLPLARGWNNPPAIQELSSEFIFEGYDRKQRAYVLQCRRPDYPSKLEFTLAADKKTPVLNPIVLIRDWGTADAFVRYSGKKMIKDSDFCMGHEAHPDGTDLVVWMNTEVQNPVKFEIVPVQKAAASADLSSSTATAEESPASTTQLPVADIEATGNDSEAQSAFPENTGFGAFYTNLDFEAQGRSWPMSEEADVEVRFDQPGHRFLFWRKNSYVPAWVPVEGPWYMNTLIRQYENAKQADSFYSPILDSRCLYSRVRVIEDNDARIVIHWRYSPVNEQGQQVDADPVTGWPDWVDEYYTFYPDSVGARRTTLYCRSALTDRLVCQAGILQNPTQTDLPDFKDASFIVGNLKGQSKTYEWIGEQQPALSSLPDQSCLQIINMNNNDVNPFFMVDPNKGQFNFQNPPRQPAYAETASGESLFSSLRWTPQLRDKGEITWDMLYGATNHSFDELVRLAKSWLQAPKLMIHAAGQVYKNEGYDPGQRAYVIDGQNVTAQSDFQGNLLGSKKHPIVNPVLVIKNWGREDAELWLDNQKMEKNKDYRAGHQRHQQGTDLIIWMNFSGRKPMDITLKHSSE